MKSKLLLLFLFSVIFCSQPFLRKLDEAVTEESCKAKKKKFQAAVPAKCKFGETEVVAEKETDCKKGTWSDTERCTADEIKKKENCQGVPEYTAAVEAVAATCTLEGYGTIKSFTGGETDCEKTLEWVGGICESTPQSEQGDCTDEGKWSSGICIDKTQTTQACGDGFVAAAGVCISTSKKTETECNEASLTWSTGVCSVSEITSKDKCTGTPVYNAGSEGDSAKCTAKDGTSLNRKTEAECEVELEWLSGTCSNNQPVASKSECENDGTYTAGTAAKCVDDDSGSSTSSSYFLKAINFVLIAVCLLL